VSDVDFDQTEDIVIGPTVDLNLIFFELDDTDFITTTALPIVTVSDTTDLNFLESNFLDNNLRQIDFTHQFDNRFSQAFEARILFLSEEGVLQYEIDIPIPANRTTTNTDIVVDPDLGRVLAATQVVTELTIIPNTLPISGSLRHRSKGVFYLTIDDL